MGIFHSLFGTSKHSKGKKYNPSSNTNSQRVNVLNLEIQDKIEAFETEKQTLLKMFTNDYSRLRKMGNTLMTDTDNSQQRKIVESILNFYSPDVLKWIIIDDSRIIYNDINGSSNLLTPVITNMKHTNSVLKWAADEIFIRYSYFKKIGKKNIDEYNQAVIHNSDEAHTLEAKPYIIILIHEAYLLLDEGMDSLNKIALYGNQAGIYFLMFSQYSDKYLPLGPVKDLVNRHSINDLQYLFLDSKPTNNMVHYNENMTGLEFEHFSCSLLKNNGFQDVTVTKASGDYGCDIIHK